MYGQGNYGSGPPFQQRPPPPPLQQGSPSLRPPIYQHGPPPSQPDQSTGMNLGQQYPNRYPPPPPPPSMQVPQYYSTGQHAQNMLHIRPEIPTSVSGNTVQPSSLGQGQSANSLPTPHNSYSYPMSQVSQLPSMVPPPPLPTSLPQALARPGTSTSPAHEVQLSAHDLGQSCSNYSGSKEKASDSVDTVTTPNQSVDNLPAHGNSLENDGDSSSSLQHHSLTDADTSHSPSNSDMDMEDDFTHPVEDASICLSNFNHGSSTGPVSNSKTAVEQDSVSVGVDISKDPESGSTNSFQISDSSILSKELDLQVNSLTHQSSCPHEVFDQSSLSVDMAGKDFEKSANHTTKKISPLKLLGDYASDDSAENSEAHVRPAKPDLASLLPSEDHSGKLFDPLVESSAVSLGLLESNVKSQSDIPDADIGSSSARDFENVTVQEIETQKASKVDSSLEVIRDDATTGITQKEELKSTSGVGKVDEFGRLVREDHSDVDSGDPPLVTRRRTKRGRSRSWSRSPIRGRTRSRSLSLRGRRSSRSRSPRGRRSRSRSPRGRRSSRSRSPRGRRRSRSHSPHGRKSSHSPRGRRRSPRRRQGRHGRSRSFSPKRHQSRSKSPSYRRAGEFGTEKTRRHKAQLPDCLDYIRNKCYRGDSCRYLHRQSDKTNDRLRSSHMKHQNDVLPMSKSSKVYGDTDTFSPKRSVHEHKEHDESQSFKQEVVASGERIAVAEELSDGPTKLPYTETSIGAHVHQDTDTKVPSDISNFQTQLMDGQAAADSSLQTSRPVQSQLPSSRSYLSKDSSSTSSSHPVSTDQPFTSESTMPQSYLPELPPSDGNQSSNLLVGNSLTFSNHIPADYNLIHQHSQFPPPSNTSWNSLPPPPPFPFPFPCPNNSMGNTTSGLPSSQFQQNMQPSYSDHHYQASTGVGQPVMYPQMSEPHKYLYDATRFGPRIMPVVSKPIDQIHGPSSHNHPYMHHSPGNLHSAPDGVKSYYGEPGNTIAALSNCSSDNPVASQPQHFTDLGRSRPFSHFPPLASTLNEPLTSKFYSDETQRKDVPYCDIYGTPYSLNNASADRVTAKGSFPAPAGDQYDPLSDSIEPSSSSMKKPDVSQVLPNNDSGAVLRTSGFNQLLDVGGNNKLKGSGGAEGSLSLENYEYGETADAEVGDVEDGSASNPQSAADMAAEEDEVNRDKAPGKSNKGKDSKSMKFFKIAIADFVKEVLKPSWRQGNMSKEAFKTIVKKTVDKVSAATGKRQIPKSREKLEHYIDSQQRKLTKLVMGYVDKYVNA